jgi:hypothetical protein
MCRTLGIAHGKGTTHSRAGTAGHVILGTAEGRALPNSPAFAKPIRHWLWFPSGWMG